MPLIFNHFPTNAILAMRVILLYSLLFPGIVFGQTANRSPKPPNIIFILADDLGYGDIGVFYQNERRQKDERHEPWFSTPHLDELANSGKMLTSHYCGAPVCAPSRASLLLGLSQGQANVRDNQFDKALADQFTLGSLLQRAGYHTAAIGKWGLQGEGEGPDWPAHPLKRGFEYYLGYIRHRDGHEHYPKEGIYRGQKEVWENHTNLTAGLDKCYTGDLWTAAAKRYVSNQVHDGNDKPFFLYLAYDNPHAALELPTQAYPEGGGQSGGLQWLGRPGQMINTASGQPDSWIDPSFRSATWDDDADPSTPEQPWPDTYKRYATIVTRLDRQVGDLVSLLKDLHILENTLIVFTSDNGPSQESYLPKGTVPNEPDFFNSFGPFDGIKRDMWEGGARVPAIVAWRGHITAGRIDAPSAFYDWMATFANISGYAAPAFTDGHSLWSLLSGEWTREDRTVYSEYYVGGRTPGYSDFDSSHRNRLRRQMQLYRWNDTVAVRYDIQSPGDDFEVYAIDQDPQQKRNLAANNRLPGLQKFLKAEVVRRHRPDSSAIRPYDTAFLEPVSPEGQIQAGWSFIFVGNDCPWLASLPDVVALHKLKVPGLEAPGLHTGDSGMLYWEGYIHAPATGDYLFYLNTAAPTVVKVYNLDLFNAEFQYGGKKPLASSLRLRKGLHPIRVYCRLYAGKMHSVPVLRWSGPGFSGIKEFSAVHSTRADK